jgi:hypothetical protein
MTDDLDPIAPRLIEADILVKIDRNLDGLGLEKGRPRPAMSGSEEILREITSERIGPSDGRAHVEALKIELAAAITLAATRLDYVLRVVRAGESKLKRYALTDMEGCLPGCRSHVEGRSGLSRIQRGSREDQNRQAECVTSYEKASHPDLQVNFEETADRDCTAIIRLGSTSQ